jgi:hypothetical protein
MPLCSAKTNTPTLDSTFWLCQRKRIHWSWLHSRLLGLKKNIFSRQSGIYVYFVLMNVILDSSLGGLQASTQAAKPTTVAKNHSQLMQVLLKRCSQPLPTLLTQRVGKADQALIIITIWTSLMCPACHDLHKKTIPALISLAKKRSDICLVLQDNPVYPVSLCASSMVMAVPQKKQGKVLDFLFSQDLDPTVATVQDVKSKILGQWSEDWGISKQELEKKLDASQQSSRLEACFGDKQKECQTLKLENVPYIVVASRSQVSSTWSVKTVNAPDLTSTIDSLIKSLPALPAASI